MNNEKQHNKYLPPVTSAVTCILNRWQITKWQEQPQQTATNNLNIARISKAVSLTKADIIIGLEANFKRRRIFEQEQKKARKKNILCLLSDFGTFL